MAGIKRTSADIWFSLFVRARDCWKCQRCHRQFVPYVEGGDNRHLQGLDCAHGFSRGNNMTRFEPDNAIACCYGCHSKIDANPEEKRELFIKIYGKDRYEELRVLSKKPFKGIKNERKGIAEHFRKLFRAQVDLDKNIDSDI